MVAIAATICPIFLLLACGARGFISRRVDVLHSQCSELCAKPVEIQSQFTSAQPLARLLFSCGSLQSQTRDFRGFLPLHHHDSVRIGDNHISGLHTGATAYYRDVYGAGACFDGSLRGDGFRPDGESYLLQLSGVAYAGVEASAG